ncbi:MAG: glycoside hydrolase family 2 protein [Nocardioides sp.]|nr:glycoside hydrolase family 2 protein [Nocardioides sp.]
MAKTTLQHGWTLRLGAGPRPHDLPAEIPASVPGCVHTDLLDNGLIPDPFVDLNEHEVQWIGETDARYRTVFDVVDEGHERIDLVAEGLDTVATVTLNGAVVGRTKNQHRTYRFDVRSAISAGNELVVDFDAPLRAVRESEQRIGVKAMVPDLPHWNALRKMACNFGPDFGPALTTAGIWRSMSVHQWSVARLVSVVPTVTVDDGTGRVALQIDLERTGAHLVDLEVGLVAPDGCTERERLTTTAASAAVELSVSEPELWWPRGHGGQPLYRLTVRASNGDTPLGEWSHDIGFRTAEVKISPDEYGTSLEFHVNGEFVWVRGANWIPGDCFPSRFTRADLEARLRDAVDAGMNMLRVWGGGLYASDDFYDICNREGILVWQDFLFSCATYSEAPEMWAEVEAEAREHVARLAPNPSLVIWNGGNENLEGYYHWGFKERMEPDETWGRGYYDELLPGVLAQLDPTRAYIPSSPWSPDDYADPRDPDRGPTHTWRVWYSDDYLTYRTAIPRFVAEFGFQAPPNWATLTAAVHDKPMTPESPGMLVHQKAIDGNGKLERGWAPHLPEPTSFDDWHFTTQLNQARAVSCAVSHFRSHAPRNAGYLVWQLTDCWPAISWAVVDNAGRRKPLWFALRALNAPRVLLLQPRGDTVALIVSNDSADPWVDTVTVSRRSTDGSILASEDLAVSVPPRSNVTLALPEDVRTTQDAEHELLVASCSGGGGVRRGWWWFCEDIDLGLPAPALATAVRRTECGYDVEVAAEALVKDLVLNVDRLDPDATVSDQLVTMLPGENHTFSVMSGADLDVDSLTAHPVLHSANHLAHPIQEGARA